jgi:hypothetical protein
MLHTRNFEPVVEGLKLFLDRWSVEGRTPLCWLSLSPGPAGSERYISLKIL